MPKYDSNMESMRTRIFLAQHPVLNNLTRAMSTFGSVSRGVLSITTAFSTAILAFNSTQSGLAQTQAELDQARREQALALQSYGYDSEEYANATESVNSLTTKIAELQAQTTTEKMLSVLNVSASIGYIGGAAAQLIKDGTLTKLSTAFLGLRTTLMAVGAAGWFSLGPLALIAIAGALVAASIYDMLTPGNQLADWMKTFFPEWRDEIDLLGLQIFVAFTQDIPNALIGFLNLASQVATSFVNLFVAGINNIIKDINSLSGLIGLPKIKLFSEFVAPQMPLITSAGGILLNNAGKFGGGGESVSTPSSVRGGGGGTTVINNYNIAGTVKSERELNDFVDKTVKQTLKDHGWN